MELFARLARIDTTLGPAAPAYPLILFAIPIVKTEPASHATQVIQSMVKDV